MVSGLATHMAYTEIPSLSVVLGIVCRDFNQGTILHGRKTELKQKMIPQY